MHTLRAVENFPITGTRLDSWGLAYCTADTHQPRPTTRTGSPNPPRLRRSDLA
jgi:hypothetical protein